MENTTVEQALIDWAIDEVAEVIGDDADVTVEPKIEREGEKFGYFGFADLVCGEHIFDLKSGGILPMPGYRAQLAGYALPIMEREFRDFMWGHELYVDARYHRYYKITLEEAKPLVEGIIQKHTDPNASPVSCTYCKWCRHTLTCSALLDFDKDMKYDLNKPEELAAALLKTKGIKAWCDAVEKAAKEHLGEGKPLEGWRLQSRKGRESLDATEAWRKLGQRIGTDRFFSACTLNLNKLRKVWEKDYTEELPVENLITRAKDSIALVESKENESESNEPK